MNYCLFALVFCNSHKIFCHFKIYVYVCVCVCVCVCIYIYINISFHTLFGSILQANYPPHGGRQSWQSSAQTLMTYLLVQALVFLSHMCLYINIYGRTEVPSRERGVDDFMYFVLHLLSHFCRKQCFSKIWSLSLWGDPGSTGNI